jgi:UDP-hydrolysing UDP-N-acetyl-D-glucosamine 2-epimerase
MAKTRKIAVVLIDRANYGRLKPVMEEMAMRPEIELQVVLSGTMMLDRFGMAKNVVIKDGFKVDEEVYMELEGSVPGTMAQSIGLGVIQFTNAFRKLNPDFILLIGDRYEALSAAIAAVYQNFCLIHMQGGEVTGSIDETTRHVITKMAHYHFPATKRSGEYIVAMGEDPKTVFPLGCPSADVVVRAMKDIPEDKMDKLGVGPHLNLHKPFLLVIFHPVTTEFSVAERQMQEVLEAIKETGIQTILLWPNIDAGADGVSQAVRRFRELNRDFPLHAYKNFEPEVYIPILAMTACAVGNSSSFVRDASFLGTPVVLIGSRQDGREFCDAVHRIEPETGAIVGAIKRQLSNGRYRPSDLYGVPGASKMIVEELSRIEPYVQKRIHYIHK